LHQFSSFRLGDEGDAGHFVDFLAKPNYGNISKMPRQARLDIAGVLQHVMVRGIEKIDIFVDDRDRLLFLERLSRLLIKTGTDCLAWSLLTNHVASKSDYRTPEVPFASSQ